MPTAPGRRVALVTLGCGRNEVDSEELAGRLAADGWLLVAEPADADVALVNTCGFVEAAKKDSVDTLLAAADLKHGGRTKAVVAVGCLAERYGEQLAEALPEADAVLGFDDYADISARLQGILAGEQHVPHVPRDRRTLLPLAPADRPAVAVPQPARPDLPAGVAPASGPQPLRMRLGDGPTAALKLASGCDRRCTFCAIPTFRGSFVSRRPHEVLAEAAWLAGQGVRELVLVSENSTSYGKDLGDIRLLESLLPDVAAVDGIARVRVSYLQPAEMRPGLGGGGGGGTGGGGGGRQPPPPRPRQARRARRNSASDATRGKCGAKRWRYSSSRPRPATRLRSRSRSCSTGSSWQTFPQARPGS
jgi:ribosomal protein S12 methylthiotransferase